MSLKGVNSHLQSTLKHPKYLCRYDHIFVKLREAKLVDEVFALDLLFTVLVHGMMGGGWNSNCIACYLARVHVWAIHIDMDMTTRVNTTACVLQGRGNPPRRWGHQDHVPPSVHEARRIFLFQPPHHVNVGRAGALAL